mgnify:CR=1 FL=1
MSNNRLSSIKKVVRGLPFYPFKLPSSHFTFLPSSHFTFLPSYLFTLLSFSLLTLLLFTSCGGRSGYFKMTGRFLHLNQGEVYVYSPDGIIDGLDTIKIEAGRFAYEIPCKEKGTLVMVFPNYSEHAVFAEPGEAVSVKADASHLKEMEVEGTDDNELMTTFRKMVSNVSPPEEVKLAGQFVKDHPEAYMGLYLVRKYFLQSMNPDYKQAALLLTAMEEEQADNYGVKRLKTQVQQLSVAGIGSMMPAFKAKDINGQPVSDAGLRSGVTIINVWSMWNYTSQEMLRTIREAYRRSGREMKVVTICVDPQINRNQRDMIERDTITWPVVCDGMLIESPVMKKLGLSQMPDVVIYQNGRVVARGLSGTTLREKLQDLLK